MPGSRVFVTGATGYLGGAIAARLTRAGHTVLGLVRDESRAALLGPIGAQPVIGDLTDPRHWMGSIKNCDAVVHAATRDNDPEAFDRIALEAVRAAAEDGRVRRFLYTSGMWVHGDTGGAVVEEVTPLRPLAIVAWRPAHEELALELKEHEVRTVVFRPTIVYGESRGILGAMFAEARDRRRVTVPGDGSQIWGLVHRDDVAEAYALALEHAEGGERFILNDGAGLTARAVGEAIARVTGTELAFMPREDVLRTLGPYGEALLASQRSTAAHARRSLGWVPRHTSFVDEIERLFREWMSSQGASVR